MDWNGVNGKVAHDYHIISYHIISLSDDGSHGFLRWWNHVTSWTQTFLLPSAIVRSQQRTAVNLRQRAFVQGQNVSASTTPTARQSHSSALQRFLKFLRLLLCHDSRLAWSRESWSCDSCALLLKSSSLSFGFLPFFRKKFSLLFFFDHRSGLRLFPWVKYHGKTYLVANFTTMACLACK